MESKMISAVTGVIGEIYDDGTWYWSNNTTIDISGYVTSAEISDTSSVKGEINNISYNRAQDTTTITYRLAGKSPSTTVKTGMTYELELLKLTKIKFNGEYLNKINNGYMKDLDYNGNNVHIQKPKEEVPSGYTLTIASGSGFVPTVLLLNGTEYTPPNGNESIIENVVKITYLDFNTCGISSLSVGIGGTTDQNFINYCLELENGNKGYQGPADYTLTQNFTYKYGHNTCLASNTLVLTNEGYKEINDIGVGTTLLTYNNGTQQNEYKQVLKWWHHPSSDLVIINDNLFTMTGDHPIYINDYEVVKGREVKVGDYLIDKDGYKVLVEKVEFSNELIEVYMIEVEDNHNFYITDKNLLSHNY